MANIRRKDRTGADRPGIWYGKYGWPSMSIRDAEGMQRINDQARKEAAAERRQRVGVMQREQLIQLRRSLKRAGVDMYTLPPFAVSEDDFATLQEDELFARENINGPVKGVYSLHGLRIMKAYG